MGLLKYTTDITKLHKISERVWNIIENHREDKYNHTKVRNKLVMPALKAMGYRKFKKDFVYRKYENGCISDIDLLVESTNARVVVNLIPLERNLEYSTRLEKAFEYTNADLGILTNGNEYRIFTKLNDTNKMCEEPIKRLKISDITTASEFMKFSVHNIKYTLQSIK